MKLISLDGTVKVIKPNEGYTRRPGDKVYPDPECLGSNDIPVRAAKVDLTLVNDDLAALDKAVGPGEGDWIKYFLEPAAKVLGQSNCTRCKTQTVVINARKKLNTKYGLVEGTVKMVELIYLAKQNPDEAVQKLKEYLA